MERAWNMDAKSLFETKAYIPPPGGPQMTCQIITTPVWHIPTHTGQSSLSGTTLRAWHRIRAQSILCCLLTLCH